MNVMQCCGGSVDKVRFPHSPLASYKLFVVGEFVWWVVTLAIKLYVVSNFSFLLYPTYFHVGKMTTHLLSIGSDYLILFFNLFVILLPLKIIQILGEKNIKKKILTTDVWTVCAYLN